MKMRSNYIFATPLGHPIVILFLLKNDLRMISSTYGKNLNVDIMAKHKLIYQR